MSGVNHQPLKRLPFEPVIFTFNGHERGGVFPPSKREMVVPLKRPAKISVVDAIFCPATYAVFLPTLNLQGGISLQFKKRFSIAQFNLGPIEPNEPSNEIDENILTNDLIAAIVSAAIEAGTTKAMWYPPNTDIPGDGGIIVNAGKNGLAIYLPPSPTGGKGVSRKIGPDGQPHHRVWDDLKEIEITIRLMETAEAEFKSSNYPNDNIDLSTKAKREQWVADSTQIWSVGTVHVQLAMARKLGLIKPGRKTK